jgi:hypothetical protein
MTDIFGTASITNGKPRRIEGLPLIRVEPYSATLHDYYVTTDGRYEIHWTPRHAWDQGSSFYWFVDTLTGERLREDIPEQTYPVSDGNGGEIMQTIPARPNSPIYVSGFRNAVRKLKEIIEREG